MRAVSLESGTKLGTTVFTPNGFTGAAVIAALAAAATHVGGGIVQLKEGTYQLAAADTLVVGDGCTLRGSSMTTTTLVWQKQTLATGSIRKHQGMIHGNNAAVGWVVEDLAIVAPQEDWMSWYIVRLLCDPPPPPTPTIISLPPFHLSCLFLSILIALSPAHCTPIDAQTHTHMLVRRRHL